MPELVNAPTANDAARHTKHRIWWQTLSVSVVSLSLISGWAIYRSGSPTIVLPFVGEERLLVDPVDVKLADQTPGSISEFKVQFVNHTLSNVRLLGAEPSCSCIVLDDLPVSLPPGHGRELKLKIHVGPGPGPLMQSVKFFTDYPALRDVTVTIQGNIR